MTVSDLVQAALAVREKAYAPYSHFPVGAALLAEDGRVFLGTNVENVSYGLTICAERAAIFAAVAQGVRRFRRIAVVADAIAPVTPCGACRQVLAEFGPDIMVTCCNLTGQTFDATVGELLPSAFSSPAEAQ